MSRNFNKPIEWFWKGPRRNKQDKTGQKLDWHLIPGSLRVSRKCRRPMHWLLEIHRSSKQCLTRLARESWESANAQKVSQTDEMVKGGSYMFKSGLNLIDT